MKIKSLMKITFTIQAIYLVLIALDFLCIFLFTKGMQYTYPFAIIGSVLIHFTPIEFVCFFAYLISLYKEKNTASTHYKVKTGIIISAVLVLLCLLKILLIYYSNVLVGVV